MLNLTFYQNAEFYVWNTPRGANRVSCIRVIYVVFFFQVSRRLSNSTMMSSSFASFSLPGIFTSVYRNNVSNAIQVWCVRIGRKTPHFLVIKLLWSSAASCVSILRQDSAFGSNSVFVCDRILACWLLRALVRQKTGCFALLLWGEFKKWNGKNSF